MAPAPPTTSRTSADAATSWVLPRPDESAPNVTRTSTWSPATSDPRGRLTGTAKARSPGGISDATGPARTRASRVLVTTSPVERPARSTRPAAWETTCTAPGWENAAGTRAVRREAATRTLPRGMDLAATTTSTVGPTEDAERTIADSRAWTATRAPTARTPESAKDRKDERDQRPRTDELRSGEERRPFVHRSRGEGRRQCVRSQRWRTGRQTSNRALANAPAHGQSRSSGRSETILNSSSRSRSLFAWNTRMTSSWLTASISPATPTS